MIIGHSANAAWHNLVRSIYKYGSVITPRSIQTVEILGHTSIVSMAQPVTTIRPKLGKRFLFAEADFILKGKNDVISLTDYSKAISSFGNDHGFFDGSYGLKFRDQVSYILDTLLADNYSRQAVMTIWRENPRPSKDIPCTISVQWMLRPIDGDVNHLRLDCFDTMRSSDAWLGWPYDVFNFSMASMYILLLLRPRMRHTKIDLGDLYLTAASQHLYVRPFDDGAKNIPYDIEDVKAVTLMPAPNFDDYLPLDPNHFKDADDFLDYIEFMKDHGANEPTWPFRVDVDMIKEGRS